MKTNWKYDNNGTVEGIDKGNCLVRIADVFGYDEAERDEHGRLIASAPELLHAAKLAINVLEVKYEDGKGILDAESALHAFGNLREAIAKAEGKEV